MIKQVIVMRTDLNMRKGKMVAQGAHASMKAILNQGNFLEDEYILGDGGDWFTCFLTPQIKEWLQGSFAKICVGIDNEEELSELYRNAREAGLPCSLIIDEGRTEFAGMSTKTCVAIGPAESELIDKFTGNLKLL